MPICFKCEKKCVSVNALSVHLRISHNVRKQEIHCCSEFGCSGIFSNWERYRKHLISFHQHPSKLKFDRSLISSDINFQHVNIQNKINSNDIDDIEQLNVKDECTEEQKDITNSLEQFLLTAKLYANHQLPRSHVQNILDDSRDLVQQMISVIKSTITDILTSNGVTGNTVGNIESCLDRLLQPFAVLSSEYRRFKAFTTTGCFIDTVDHIVGQRTDEKLRDSNIIKEIVPVFAKFIPMREVLQKLFNL